MRLLITNDDGIDAPGLLALARALHDDGHEVVVAAPSTERSGSSAGLGDITHGAVVSVRTARLPGLEDLTAVAVDAPPAFAVRAACCGVLGAPPELVVSGINPGHNLGRLLLHSATVGAAVTACLFDVPGIAVSCGADLPFGFATAARVATAAVRAVESTRPGLVALGVNVPDRADGDVAGVRSAPLDRRSTLELRVTTHPDGWQLHRDVITDGFAAGSDADLVERGFVTVSALGGDLRCATDIDAVVESMHRAVSAGDDGGADRPT